jgi:GNAT superfamily N-acetyltransferase
MELHTSRLAGKGSRLTFTKEGKEIARLRLYFIENDQHQQPYALIEDLFVQEEFRGQSLGTKLMQAAIEEARKEGCYKILATSRTERTTVHEFYRKLGFKEWGKEFRMELEGAGEH